MIVVREVDCKMYTVQYTLHCPFERGQVCPLIRITVIGKVYIVWEAIMLNR